ncbi:isocitrate lyase/phosphoenolpyruvate mutase family protein [Shimia sp. R11_0]|uniref:isocitrate lyase/PEP mutase family protein n=1 Tax=Shimia sp. R11_0 TaxID=2821096 RepID=UPI001ADCD510|nr:isocitrate lyase/phosphoenolpyruvate mutase family protein [Shimia sp. R11_0]MBO9477970.1 isocitrate lyase/phosphoenolpyruvate mutase family protein [Shimia sp. R11_0]
MTQKTRAEAFAALHQPGTPLVLYNCWDAGSAAAIAQAGAPALATGSWSVAVAQGYSDGEDLPMTALFDTAKRITATTELPVSVDFEGGYATDPAALSENIKGLLTTGAVGLNFEDRVVSEGKGLHPLQTQVSRIQAIRATAEAQDLPLYINARTDVFLQAAPETHAAHFDEAARRVAAYVEAGASGVFVPGLTDPELIKRMVAHVQAPVNVLCLDVTADISPLAALGVARISFGPAPYRAAMKALSAEAARHYESPS